MLERVESLFWRGVGGGGKVLLFMYLQLILFPFIVHTYQLAWDNAINVHLCMHVYRSVTDKCPLPGKCQSLLAANVPHSKAQHSSFQTKS